MSLDGSRDGGGVDLCGGGTVEVKSSGKSARGGGKAEEESRTVLGW